jgi:hypothetical protein
MKPLSQPGRRTLRKLTAVFFVLIIAGFGFVQAVHVHDALAKQTSPASHCSLCAVTHSAVAITPVNAVIAPVVTKAAVAVSDPQLQSYLEVTSSFIRPPPQNL